MRVEHLDVPVETWRENPEMAPQVCCVGVRELAEKLSVGVQDKYSLTHFNTLRRWSEQYRVTGLGAAYDKPARFAYTEFSVIPGAECG